MKRLLMMVPIVALAVTGFAPAQAESEKTPIVASCFGEAGYEQTQNGIQWKARAHKENVAFFSVRTCGVWSPDTAEPLGPPPPPPLPEPDPGNPDPIGDQVFWLDEWAGPSNPADAGLGTVVELSGAGDFACGEGKLQHQQGGGGSHLMYQNGGVAHGATWFWQLDWTATFSNGVGEISGTATRTFFGDSNPLETRTLSGRIVVDDGAAVDQCDDSAGAARFAVTLVLE